MEGGGRGGWRWPMELRGLKWILHGSVPVIDLLCLCVLSADLKSTIKTGRRSTQALAT